MHITILLLAAGSGSRFGSDIPKQYVSIHGLPLLVHCLNSLACESRIRCIQPVIAEGDRQFQKAIEGHNFPFHLLEPVTGGAERGQSMASGLAALPAEAAWVAVHDAARPVPSPALLGDVFDTAERYGAAIPGLAVHDTIKQIDEEGKVVSTLDRARLRAVQTPQVAHRSWFEQAVKLQQESLCQYTDDAALLEAAGFDVYLSQGDVLNRKVTTREDMEWLSNVLEKAAAK